MKLLHVFWLIGLFGALQNAQAALIGIDMGSEFIKVKYT